MSGCLLLERSKGLLERVHNEPKNQEASQGLCRKIPTKGHEESHSGPNTTNMSSWLLILKQAIAFSCIKIEEEGKEVEGEEPIVEVQDITR